MSRSARGNQSAGGRRLRRQRKKGAWETIFGNVLLEVIAVAALAMLINVSKTASEGRLENAESSLQRTTDYGSFVAGFVSDQLEQIQ